MMIEMFVVWFCRSAPTVRSSSGRLPPARVCDVRECASYLAAAASVRVCVCEKPVATTAEESAAKAQHLLEAFNGIEIGH